MAAVTPSGIGNKKSPAGTEFWLDTVKWSHWLCPTLFDPTDCSPPGSSVHEILQARILVAMPSFRRSSQPRDWTLHLLHCRQVLCHWVTGKTLYHHVYIINLSVHLSICPPSCPRMSVPPGQDICLFCSWSYPCHLEECLAHNRCSINIRWMN